MNNFEKIGDYELNLEYLGKLSIKAMFILFPIILCLHYLINPFPDFTFGNFLFSTFLVILYYITLIFLHEICHLVGFILFTDAKLSSLRIGLDLKKGIAYATTTAFMSNKGARKALLLPFWLTGIIPLIAAIYSNHLPLTIVSILLIIGAIGDFAMYRKLRTLDSSVYILDDPEKPMLHFYKKNKPIQE